MTDAPEQPAVPQSHPALPAPPRSDADNPTLTSHDLLQGHREVLIRHGEETYRLRLTRNGKLILHK
jgi:hemin uptake protein HemP